MHQLSYQSLKNSNNDQQYWRIADILQNASAKPPNNSLYFSQFNDNTQQRIAIIVIYNTQTGSTHTHTDRVLWNSHNSACVFLFVRIPLFVRIDKVCRHFAYTVELYLCHTKWTTVVSANSVGSPVWHFAREFFRRPLIETKRPKWLEKQYNLYGHKCFWMHTGRRFNIVRPESIVYCRCIV